MMWHAILLGVIQGLTEFLPVSSSGHLVLARHLIGLEEAGVAFDVLLHLGTMLAIAVVYAKDLAALVRSGLRFVTFRGDLEDRRRVLTLAIGIAPVVVVGLAFQDTIERAFDAPRLAASMLLVTAVLLFVSHRFRRASGPVTGGRALFIGLVQILAILPGVSRSGSTIAAGMVAGVRPDRAARFTFLMAVPLFLGAALVELPHLSEGGTGMSAGVMLAGFLTSFVAGYAAIRWLLAVLSKGRFVYFGVYCALVGIAGLVFF